MKIVFDDSMFDAQLLRTMSHIYYGGAEVGECLTTAARIKNGDTDAWYSEWTALAERLYAQGQASLAAGHSVSARESFLRASNYFRNSYIMMYSAPVDPRLVKAYDRQTEAFRKAAAHFSPAVEVITIPYEGTTLPGYFFRVDESPEPRPTLILTGGYDGTAEELYFWNVAAALRRGYNCLCFDGPGQGEPLVKRGMVFRPDWERVVGPVVDYALTRSDVDSRRIALMGLSWGGYLAPRAASAEHRLAACIADPGQYDLFTAMKARMPAFLAKQLPKGNPILLGLLKLILGRIARQPTPGWALRRGMWAHGVSTPLAYVRITQKFTLKGYAKRIKCPTLVCYADQDEVAAYARQLYDELTCPKQFLTFFAAEGAGEHCESGERALFHQRVFDWLDEVLQGQVQA